jgi:hypothetical protein
MALSQLRAQQHRRLLPLTDPYRAQRVALFNAIESRMNGASSSVLDLVDGSTWGASGVSHLGDRISFATSGHISKAHDSSHNIGTGDFQIDVVVNLVSYSNYPTLASKYVDTSTGLSFGVTNSGFPYFNCTGDGSQVTGSNAVSTGVVTKLSAWRAGTTLGVSIDDVTSGSVTNSTSIGGSGTLTVGCIPAFGSTTVNGTILAFRMIVGARRTFGPPGWPFAR